MLKFGALVLLVALAGSTQNPYCGMSCRSGYHQTNKHTVCQRQNEKCGPHSRCGPDFEIVHFNDEMRKLILGLHNKLRNKVAAGNERRGNQPSASNMETMNWNMELEFIAQCWANTCNGGYLLAHDTCRRTAKYEYVGQNIAYMSASARNILDLKSTVENLVQYWYNEVGHFKRDWVSNTQDRDSNNKIGHYTQMIWARTTDLGCAVSYYTVKQESNKQYHFYYLVCNYGPGGNYIGLPVYDQGKPCKGCPRGKECDREYSALCKRPMNATKIDKSFVPIFKL